MLASCSRVPEADFYESEGIISIGVAGFKSNPDWVYEAGHLIEYVRSEENSNSRGALTFQFYLRQPGIYRLWILAGKTADAEANDVRISVTDRDNFLVDSHRIRLPESTIPEWISVNRESEPIDIFLENPGHYNINIESGGREGILISNLHLALNNDPKPEGMGLPETIYPNIDPVLAKREHHVEIPPSWAFGLLAGGDETVYKHLIEKGISIDGWWNSGENFNFIDSLQHVYVVDWAKDLEELDELFEFTKTHENRRGFFLSRATNIHHPDIKKYPALWYGGHKSGFEMLRDQVESVSNPNRPVYEIPYFAALPEWFLNRVQDTPSEELLIRWIQFSAFNSIMAVPLTIESLTESVIEQLKYYTRLRNKLHSFIYSYTLRSRTNRIKPVTGNSSHPHQYFLGGEFLVAPILEEGSEERMVWFPEGRWYDYRSGEMYDGGQSWIVEATVNEIPVFVKEGAIIPYREYSGHVLKGDNTHLVLDIYTGAAGTFRLYEDDGLTGDYWSGDFSTVAYRYFEHTDYSTFNIGAMVRGYPGQRESTHYTLRFKFMERPSAITANGEAIPGGDDNGEWFYDEENGEVVINWDQPNRVRTEFRFTF
jgi:hypothetical protein